MTKKPKFIRWWFFAAITFLVCVLLQIPAAWLMAKFYKNNQSLHNISGNIWSGQADWVKGQLHGSLSWKVRPLDFLRLRVGVDVDVQSGGSHIQAVAAYDLGRQIILHDVYGQISNVSLKHLVNWQWPSNPIQLQNIAVTYKPNQGFSGVEGQLQWVGGDLGYSYAQRQEHMNMPSLTAKLTTSGGKLVLDGRDQGGQKLLNLALDENFMLDVQLTQRLLMNVASYQGKAGLDTYVITTRQPLMKRGM